ncbi:MAG: hypothetical protein QOG80_429 [Pseudonocardiales bacterium]|jgi:hypothetical protein|nr:hypothetical protein [Pseudonocardiales bacterium]
MKILFWRNQNATEEVRRVPERYAAKHEATAEDRAKARAEAAKDAPNQVNEGIASGGLF